MHTIRERDIIQTYVSTNLKEAYLGISLCAAQVGETHKLVTPAPLAYGQCVREKRES